MKICSSQSDFSLDFSRYENVKLKLISPQGGYLRYWYTGVCVWRVNSGPKIVGPSKLYFRILVHDANLLPKNMGANFVFKTKIPSTLAQNVQNKLRNDFNHN